ncbi:hypothetical protein CBER1_00234 [Cercospora berteroae]|uniref:Alpha 1,4-glycosyltransferase domain-containing protein n=1 Tax=Cercospora berteroae TaxID=357750 RepID=A0A2S6CDG2_9PEZI|nr:hypothetical protein CBER1_00234 [Cercospora berteroae]
MLHPRLPGLLLVTTLILFLYSQRTSLATHINQLSWQVERRIVDWNWKDTPEEKLCRATDHTTPKHSKNAIPNIVHFILLAREGAELDLTYAQYLAIKAALLRMDATQVKVHTNGIDATNKWWRDVAPKVVLETVDTTGILDHHGVPIANMDLPHQTDILRIAILLREGGIYMDTDVYALKPFTDLLNSPRDTLMGHEGGNHYGLCNAVIVSRPGSDFLVKWQKTYTTFDPKKWNEHSVLMPKKLQVRYPELLCPLSPSVFFWPTWGKDHIRYMHEPTSPADVDALLHNMTVFDGAMYENQLAIHAWSTSSKEHLRQLSPEFVMGTDTRFNVLLRDVANAAL